MLSVTLSRHVSGSPDKARSEKSRFSGLKDRPRAAPKSWGRGLIMAASQRYGQERQVIGRLLIEYGEMEFDLCNCIAMGLNDLDMAFKTIFRIRGETSRIDIADAMGQKIYTSLGLGASFHDAIDATRFCLRLRNRYAHSHFYDDSSGKLAMVSLEEIAKKRAVIKDLRGLTTKYLTTEILQSQEMYFAYTRASIEFVNYEGRFLRKTLTNRVFEAPQRLKTPAEYA
jgi:hypothetical protein